MLCGSGDHYGWGYGVAGGGDSIHAFPGLWRGRQRVVAVWGVTPLFPRGHLDSIHHPGGGSAGTGNN